MVKPSAYSFLANFASCLATLLALSGCASAPSGSAAGVPASAPLLERPMDFSVSSSPVEIKRLWTQQVPGLMTDLSVSRDGSAILVATVPNPESGSGPRETGHGLTRYDR